MSRNLTASDRSALLKLASTLPVGSPERKAILAGLIKKKAARSGAGKAFSDVVTRNLRSSVPECKNCEVNFEFTPGGPTILVQNIFVGNRQTYADGDAESSAEITLLAKKIEDALEGFKVIVEQLSAVFDYHTSNVTVSIEFEVHGA